MAPDLGGSTLNAVRFFKSAEGIRSSAVDLY
jgi:hypothetical protein